MKVIASPSAARRYFAELKKRGKTVGLVPTMGALHKGHISLIRRARRENDIVAVSIFVNPTQFGKNEDFKKYPRAFRSDKQVCLKCGVDAIFHPSACDMYRKNHLTFVEVKGLSEILCGKFRPGHFKGVATVVLKLFNIIQPTRAYFGEKDYQQLKIIEKMVDDLNVPVKVIACPTVREKSGLALSSRNQYLSVEQKKSAAGIYAALKKAKSKKTRSVEALKKSVIGDLRKVKGLKIEYVAVVDPATLNPVNDLKDGFRILIAAWLGKTRLIDNV